MSLFGVFYEFEVNETNVRRLVEDVGITQRRAPAVKDVAKNLLDLASGTEREENTYAKVEIDDRPGFCLGFQDGLRQRV